MNSARLQLRRHAFLGLVAALCIAIVGRIAFDVFRALDLDEPLYGAAFSGDAGRVRSLLRAGADPNFKWKDGTTPLDASLEAGNPEVTRLLLAAGARESVRSRAARLAARHTRSGHPRTAGSRGSPRRPSPR
jgi:hypothetical protein